MKKSTTEKETKATFSCDFCNRSFVRESTFMKHLCEYKHRWLNKDEAGNRIGFNTFLQFYKKNTASKKQKTYMDYIKSSYYTAFNKFGHYCVQANVINVTAYADHLLKEQISIDNWNSDKNYTDFLIRYLRLEDPFDAVERSVKTCSDLSIDERIYPKDVLRYGNRNKICYKITTGKISPWMLYQSVSGREFLDKLNEGQVKLILDYINPEQWALRFKKYPEEVENIKTLLSEIGY